MAALAVPAFSQDPELSGQWGAELLSSYAEQGGRENKTITGTATITQTYTSLSVRLVTGEEPNTNRSFQLAGRLIRHNDGVYEVIGVYQSDPDILARGTQTEIHYIPLPRHRYAAEEDDPSLLDRSQYQGIDPTQETPMRTWSSRYRL